MAGAMVCVGLLQCRDGRAVLRGSRARNWSEAERCLFDLRRIPVLCWREEPLLV